MLSRATDDIVNLYVAMTKEHKDREEAELQTEIISWIRENMAAYKVPKRITFIDEIPLTLAGKIDKKKLRAAAIASA